MKLNKLTAAIIAITFAGLANAEIESFTDAVAAGTPSLDMNLRNETVTINNGAEGHALTLRTRIGYKTAAYEGVSAFLEVEDSRIVGGVDEYKVGPTGFNTSKDVAIIGDPETTEVDQAFLSFAGDTISAKLGRQVVVMDGHRFVGHVGWRQDRQTFDAISFDINPMENLTLKYAYLDQRNRIFAEAADVDSSDNLVNLSYKTPYGKATTYAYFLNNQDAGATRDTFGLSFDGSAMIDATKILYKAEFARQFYDQQANDNEANYYNLELGSVFDGYTLKAGYEVLSASKDGLYDFTTELATLHKFNGWADVFLNTPTEGLQDIYAMFATKLPGGFGFKAFYHKFDSVKKSIDFGDEIDLVLVKKIDSNYTVSAKFAHFDGKSKNDVDKLWLSLGAKF